MPVAEDNSALGSVLALVTSLEDNNDYDNLSLSDAQSLHSLLANKKFQKLVKIHEYLRKNSQRPNKEVNTALCDEIVSAVDSLHDKDTEADELRNILKETHFRSLIETHDSVLQKTYATPPPSPSISLYHEGDKHLVEPIRVVGLHRTTNDPLGITLSVDQQGNIYIARILHGSMIDRQGLLNVGDVIKQVNGKIVAGNPDVVQAELKNNVESISLKVYPSYRDTNRLCQVFVKVHFDFDATKDKNIPCGEAGYSFKKGDILEIVDQSDANWWQARSVDGSGKTGIIPSQMLEENRRTRITPFHKESRVRFCGTTRSKKRKIMYSSLKNAAFDRLEIPVYEEVAKMPPFERKTLILIGASRVGRRMLKNKLIWNDPSDFGSTIAHTSRPCRSGEKNGCGYYFVSRNQMQKNIDEGQFLEWGEYGNNLYGTKIDTVRTVMRSGKMCILDVYPTALKILKTAEFMPFVVFIAPPNIETLRELNNKSPNRRKFTETELQETIDESRDLYNSYFHYFDMVLVNDYIEKTYVTLKAAIEALNTESQWVPVNWVY